MSATTGASKENNKNLSNTNGRNGQKTNKRFMGGNIGLQGKTFEISSRDAVHQYTETLKVIADYVGQEYKHSGDIHYMIENMADYNFMRPQDPSNNATQFEIESWKKALDMFWKRRGIYMDNKTELFSLIWGQSSRATQSKIKTHMNYNQCKNDYDILGLLKIMREFIFRSDDRQCHYKAEDQAKRPYYNLRQTLEMSCQEYFERVRNVVEVIKSFGGSLCGDMHLNDELPARPPSGYTDVQYKEARERILNKTLAYGILVRADLGRYGKLIEEIENAYLKVNNDYPMNPTEAYNILVNYRNYNNNKRTNIPGGLDQATFVTDGKCLKTGKEFPYIKCFKCGKFGHYKSDCPESKEKGSGEEVCQIIQATTLMTRTNQLTAKESIDPLWIFCDNESMVDIIKNRNMVTDIRVINNPIEITGIGGQPI